MMRIALVSVLSLLAGSSLALAHGRLPLRPGLVGLGLMLASAALVRRHWQSLHADAVPGSPERELWHGLASTALIAGQLLVSLWRVGPGMVLHSVAVHAMAVDSWTLVLGAFLSFRLARDPEPRRDERDSLFAARARRVEHGALVAQLCLVIVVLSFGPDFRLPSFAAPFVAHVLIVCLMFASVARCAAQLALYDRDRRAAHAAS